MIKSIFAAVLFVSAVGATEAHAFNRNRCVGTALAAVQGEGYANAYHVHTDVMSSGEGSRINGYMIWFQQPHQRGYVVVNTTETCRVTDVYTRMR